MVINSRTTVLLKFGTKVPPEEAEEPEPAPKERIARVSKFTEGFGFIETGINVFEGIDSRAATGKTR